MLQCILLSLLILSGSNCSHSGSENPRIFVQDKSNEELLSNHREQAVPKDSKAGISLEQGMNTTLMQQDESAGVDNLQGKEHEVGAEHRSSTSSSENNIASTENILANPEENEILRQVSHVPDIDIPVAVSEREVAVNSDQRDVELAQDGVHITKNVNMNKHQSWDNLLQKYVSARGKVDYSEFKKDEKSLDSYLKMLQGMVPTKTDDSPAAKSFWINAYNAFTVKLILKNYPVASIMDIDKGKPWDTKWIPLGKDLISLNNIEHDIIRTVWKDARIHFAVNCAAKSCPPLANHAFNENNIDEMLDKLTSSFINNEEFNKIKTSSLELSRIFEWYQSDFGDVVKFVRKYSTSGIKDAVRIAYADYNWSLNGK